MRKGSTCPRSLAGNGRSNQTLSVADDPLSLWVTTFDRGAVPRRPSEPGDNRLASQVRRLDRLGRQSFEPRFLLWCRGRIDPRVVPNAAVSARRARPATRI